MIALVKKTVQVSILINNLADNEDITSDSTQMSKITDELKDSIKQFHFMSWWYSNYYLYRLNIISFNEIEVRVIRLIWIIYLNLFPFDF